MLSEFLCPTCLAGGLQNHLSTGTSKFGLSCSQGHVFPDMEEFLASNPVKKALPPAPPKIQPGMTDFVVKVPVGLVEVLGKRFGKRLESSVAALLGVMTDPQAFVVVSEDVKRFQDIFASKIQSADQLVGLVYSMKIERDQFRQQAEQKSALQGPGGGDLTEMNGDYVQTTIRISVDAFTTIRDKAKFNSMSASQYIQSIVDLGMKNNWI